MARSTPDEAIEHRRFPDVGPPDDRHVDLLVLVLGGRRFFRSGPAAPVRRDRFEQRVETVAVLRRHGKHIVRKARKTAPRAIPAFCVSTLFARIASGLPCAPQQAAPARHRAASGPRARPRPAAAATRLQWPPAPAEEFRAGMAALSSGTIPPVSTTSNVRPCQVRRAVDAVARDSRLVGDNRAPRAGQPIENRGFADVRSSDDDNAGKFRGHFAAAASFLLQFETAREQPVQIFRRCL